MFGVTGWPMGSDTGMLPALSRTGIEVMSINLLLARDDDPIIWRGPLISQAITQFWEEVVWGKLHYLIVDLPPGTADAPLTVMQSLSLSGVIIVFGPQELAAMVVRKAVRMARDAMSYLMVPETGQRLEVFGKSKADEMAAVAGAPLLARLPLDPELAKLCDEGELQRDHSDAVRGYADVLLSALARLPAR